LEQAQIQRVALFISIINLGEVFCRIGKLKGENEAFQTLTEIQSLALEVGLATDERVRVNPPEPARRVR